MTFGSNPFGAGAYGGIAELGVPLPVPPSGEVIVGVKPAQVGEEYDLALGFDPGTSVITMFGYVLSPGSTWSESPNMEDEQRLVTIASPNNSDRYTFYPKVTQDDWTGGEGQEFFTDPTKYYQSFKVDVTKVGNLLATRDGLAVVVVPTGSSRAPVVSDGSSLVAGLATTTPNALVDQNGTLYHLHVAGTPEPLFGLLDPRGGAFFATASGTRGGIYRCDYVPDGTQPPVTLWNADIVEPTATQALAYVSAPAPTGGLYYLRNDNTIQQLGAVGAGVTVYTGLTMEAPLRFLCGTATGMLFATQSANTAHRSQVSSIIYSFDGVTATRIFDFPGVVRAGYEMNGVTYLILEYQQDNDAPQLTLMTYSNGQLSVLFDQRYAAPAFQSNASNFAASPYGCSLGGDGRFLYIGWPGYYALAYDTVRQAFVRWGPAPAQSNLVFAHRIAPMTAGAVDLVSVGSGGPLRLTFTQALLGSTVGTMTMSWMDFGLQGVAKAYRCIEVELQQPNPGGTKVGVSYRLDQQVSFTALGAPLTLPNGNLLFILPSGTKGYRIQLMLSLTMFGTASSVVRSVALTGNPARVWKLSLSCARGQRKRNDAADDQGTSTDLLANLLGAQKQGGFCTVYVPDPNNPSGAGTGQPYVSVTTAKVELYDWKSPVSPAYRVDNDGVGSAMEGQVEITLAEQL